MHKEGSAIKSVMVTSINKVHKQDRVVSMGETKTRWVDQFFVAVHKIINLN